MYVCVIMLEIRTHTWSHMCSYITFVCFFVELFFRSFIPSFVPSFLPSFIHPFIHSIIQSFIHSFIHSLTHSFTRSPVHSFTQSFLHSFIPSFLHSFLRAFMIIAPGKVLALAECWMDVPPTGQAWRCLDRIDFAFPPSLGVAAAGAACCMGGIHAAFFLWLHYGELLCPQNLSKSGVRALERHEPFHFWEKTMFSHIFRFLWRAWVVVARGSPWAHTAINHQELSNSWCQASHCWRDRGVAP